MIITKVLASSRFQSTYVVSSEKPLSKAELQDLLKSEILAEFNQVFAGEEVDDLEEITEEEYLAMWADNPEAEGMSVEDKLAFIKPITDTAPADIDL